MHALAVAAAAQECRPYFIRPFDMPPTSWGSTPIQTPGGEQLLVEGGFLFPTSNRFGGQAFAFWDGHALAPAGFGLPAPSLMYGYSGNSDEGLGPSHYDFIRTLQGLRAVRWTGSHWETANKAFMHGTEGWPAPRPMLTVPSGPLQGTYGAIPYLGIPYTQAARWNGTAWVPMAGGLIFTNPHFYVVFDPGTGPRLHAFAHNPVLGGPPHAILDAGGWAPMPVPLGPLVARVFGVGETSHLYVGGYGNPAFFGPIARWDGTAWSGVGAGLGQPTGFWEVTAMEVFDDGSGPALFVAGAFDTVFGGQVARNIAKWDGHQWHPVATGRIGGWVYDMEVYDDGRGPSLFLGGEFLRTPDTPPGAFLQLVGCRDQCYPDCNNDGAVTIGDVQCFQAMLAEMNPYADCNGDNALNLADFGCFTTKFALGCP